MNNVTLTMNSAEQVAHVCGVLAAFMHTTDQLDVRKGMRSDELWIVVLRTTHSVSREHGVYSLSDGTFITQYPDGTVGITPGESNTTVVCTQCEQGHQVEDLLVARCCNCMHPLMIS